MQKSDFYFDLPKELIAQEPCEPRDAARLLCLGRASGELRHAVFRDLPGLLQPGDLLVVNNSKVSLGTRKAPARSANCFCCGR